MNTKMFVYVVFQIVFCAAFTLQQDDNTTSKVEIGRGTCGISQNIPFTISCSIPAATSDMKLEVTILKQISNTKCTYGVNFGISLGNAYLWTNGGCVAEFSIFSVVTTDIATTTPMMTQASIASHQWSNAATCGQSGSGLGFRIIGGTQAGECEKSWMAFIYDQVQGNMCGGSIINSQYILTAAHCFIPEEGREARANELIIFTGTSSMANLNTVKRRYVSSIIVHEKYNRTSLVNDIALLKLRVPIVFDACHKPLCLVDGKKTPQQATNCQVMGWGRTKNTDNETATELLYVDVPVVSNAICKSWFKYLSSDTTFCAGSDGKDSCQGDSGGPLACKEADSKYYMYGVVSAGYPIGCGKAPGIYTKVSSFLSWISEKTK